MIDMSRRSFLRGVIALSAVAAVAPRQLLAAPLPRILGDGLHDDADGLNALLRGDPVDIQCAGIRLLPDGACHIRNGLFRLTRTLKIDRRGPTLIECCRFHTDYSPDWDGPILEVGYKNGPRGGRGRPFDSGTRLGWG